MVENMNDAVALLQDLHSDFYCQHCQLEAIIAYLCRDDCDVDMAAAALIATKDSMKMTVDQLDDAAVEISLLSRTEGRQSA